MIEPSVALAVLLAAFLHAGWNAMMKHGGEPFLDGCLVAALGGLMALPLLLAAPSAGERAVPFLLASAVIHFVYFNGLMAAYRVGDLSHVYPLMRGTGPLLVAVASGWALGEAPGAGGWAGIALISGGLLLIGLHRNADPKATLAALGVAMLIALYTIVDGSGVRAAESPTAYILWLFVIQGALFTALAMVRRGPAFIAHARRFWRRGMGGGAASIASYAIALWAMTQAPVAVVAALRETSVIFAALIGAVLLREPLGHRRWAAALLVAAGAVTLKLG